MKTRNRVNPYETENGSGRVGLRYYSSGGVENCRFRFGSGRVEILQFGLGRKLSVSVRVGFLNFETGLCGSVRILSSERNFNYSGLTLTDHISNIEPNNVNKLLFIRSNYNQ